MMEGTAPVGAWSPSISGRTMRTARRFGALVVSVAAVVGLLSACEANYEVQTTEVNLAVPPCGWPQTGRSA